MSNYLLCDLCSMRDFDHDQVCPHDVTRPIAAMDRGYKVGRGHYYEYVDQSGHVSPTPTDACPYFRWRE